jgi:hypothetical protein
MSDWALREARLSLRADWREEFTASAAAVAGGAECGWLYGGAAPGLAQAGGVAGEADDDSISDDSDGDGDVGLAAGTRGAGARRGAGASAGVAQAGGSMCGAGPGAGVLAARGAADVARGGGAAQAQWASAAYAQSDGEAAAAAAWASAARASFPLDLLPLSRLIGRGRAAPAGRHIPAGVAAVAVPAAGTAQAGFGRETATGALVRAGPIRSREHAESPRAGPAAGGFDSDSENGGGHFEF